MNDNGLLSNEELPTGFDYPHEFVRIMNLGIVELEPWYMLQGMPLRDTLTGLARRYPGRRLVPFARRQDNDDVACWEVSELRKVCVIHDFASAGWEQRTVFASFYDWLRQAVEDLIEFDC